MACLDKLAIRGIRSFDDKNMAIIEFFSPVTVIVGHNGSGKTTIIECLKYATTGDQPANTRGGAFVHDPKMANEKEVKAQVKLRFRAANGTRMLTVRNLSVTVKKTGLTMKTLESILALDDGEKKASKRGVISTKCAEIDAEIPQLLGVSKSVLENVIFCHQEDSYWPLAEPSALKKKFDDIFEATRYTKALDSIKSLRKDRAADLKAEKERLESLSREKTHADKLKARIADLNTTIASKEVHYDEVKREYDELVIANQKFYDYATKFREVYLKIESLQATQARYQEELDEAKMNIQEVVGTDEELEARLQNFDGHISEQKRKKKAEDGKKQDLEDELSNARRKHVELLQEQGSLRAEAKAQNDRISEREEQIREISKQHGISGFDSSPLEREKVLEFISKLNDIQRRQRTQFEKLQAESQARTEEYNNKSRQLSNELEGFKLQRSHARESIAERQSSINAAESDLDATQVVESELRTLSGDIEEKRSRLDQLKTAIQSANYDGRIAEKTTKAKHLEDQRDSLNAEFRALSLQADSRAKLDLKRTELKSKTAELKNTLEVANNKYRKLIGTDARPEAMEREVDRVSVEKEREHAEQESLVHDSKSSLNSAELNLSMAKTQLRTKKDELKALERRLRTEVDNDSLEVAIVEATAELDHRKQISNSTTGATAIYENMLKAGMQKKVCTTCNRHMDDHELVVFERYLKEQIKRTSPETLATNLAETKDWEEELDRLQKLRPFEASRNRLKTEEVPALEAQIKEHDAAIPDLAKQVEEAIGKLNDIKRELKDLHALKEYANNVSRLQKEIERLNGDIKFLESELMSTGSTKTADDVQAEIDAISADIRTNDREKQGLVTDKDRQNNACRLVEGDLHSMQLRERDLQSKAREKGALEARIETMRQEIVSFNIKLKELDSKILDAQAPIDLLEQEYERSRSELNAKITSAQRHLQELNMSSDKLSQTNKAVERYVRDKRARQLEDCNQKVEEYGKEIEDLARSIDQIRGVIAGIEKVINESGASVANLRENLRVRRLLNDIAKTQQEIDSYDMEEAARARRNFTEKYDVAKKKENDLHSKFSHVAGELSSHKAQLSGWEEDLKEYMGVYKKYTDQLISVKMSEMANNDLEKYAKALDNAIMKYHGLKMEEVNDTMRHLWNKTYQGTDIDGIKICSDVEGGASKRSYNYRVVMTKDQVEMDMRGRCSAGQKMLASIIIRLALSDSFGQNCGILALDEPTNALDTENIDALAASLVDIINERKNHSNFQLIIITHDENFLRKLGQSEVMDFYWRVSRNPRQKSIIERQQFR
ncbi:P-loop containing nucleoside triphosphate hydrolase [Pleurotus pulmonarius]